MRKKTLISTVYLYIVHALLLMALAGLIAVSYIAYPLAWIDLLSPEKTPATVAHRGASGYAPENTMEAFRLAIEMGADYLEIDLQLTKDGQIVAMHDDRVDRTTDGTGFVRSMTARELAELDAGSWFNEQVPMFARDAFAGAKVPTLSDIFDAFGGKTNYMLEIKNPGSNPGIEDKLVALIRQYRLADRVSIHSFSSGSLRKIHRLDEHIPLYQLIWYDLPAFITDNTMRQIKQYAVGISPNFHRISPQYVAKVKEAGLKIMPYTVNYQVNMERAMSWGVDGIYTDYPDRFQEVILQGRT